MADLESVAISTTDSEMTFDLDDPKYIALKNKYGKLRGLGDVVAAVTSAVGIRPCGGCKKRQESLNKLVPFNKQIGQNDVPQKD
jgi:hypothetical protein